MAQRKTVKEVDAEVKGLRQELLRLKAEVAEIKRCIPSHWWEEKKLKCPCCGKPKAKNPYDRYRYFMEE